MQFAMKDLEVNQRLISFQEVIGHLEAISFAQIGQLAVTLTPQRQFRLIVQPEHCVGKRHLTIDGDAATP